MGDTNFWGFLLQGGTDILTFILTYFPVALPIPPSLSASMLFFGVAPLLIVVGSFVNLNLLMISIGTMLVLEGIRALAGFITLLWKLMPVA